MIIHKNSMIFILKKLLVRLDTKANKLHSYLDFSHWINAYATKQTLSSYLKENK